MSRSDATFSPPTPALGVEASRTGTVLRPDQANVIVLATDPAMLGQVRVAIEDRHRIWRAESPTHAAELILASGNGVLLLDAAVTGSGTADVVRLLRQQLPELPIVVTGRRDDEVALSGLISSGDVFRFLHKPLSTERTRTFIDGAVRRQSSASEPAVRRDPPAAEDTSGARAAAPATAATRPRRHPVARVRQAGIAVAVCVAVAGTWLTAQRLRAIAADPQQSVAPATSAPTVDRDRLIAAAAAAFDAGRLAEPRGDNAIELFRQVLRGHPADAAAHQGLRRTGEALLSRADQALHSGDLLTTAAMLDAARFAEPPAARLQALQGALQTARAQLNARPPAGTVQTLDPETVSQIDQQEARALLGRATARMAAGQLTGGPRSAAALLEAARKANPSDPAVTTALDRLSEQMMLRARQALAAGRYPDAARWVHEVQTLGHDHDSPAGLLAEIETARLDAARRENQRLLDLAHERMAENRLVTPEADSAQHYLDLLHAADARFPGREEATHALCLRVLEQVREQVRQRQWSEAERGLRAAATLGADAAALRHATGVLDRVRSAERDPPLTAESALHRIHDVAAVYPSRAASTGLQGAVELEFTIGTDGATRNLVVLASSPPGTFDQAAIDAVTQWRYQPLQVDGIDVPARSRVRLRFERGDR